MLGLAPLWPAPAAPESLDVIVVIFATALRRFLPIGTSIA